MKRHFSNSINVQILKYTWQPPSLMQSKYAASILKIKMNSTHGKLVVKFRSYLAISNGGAICLYQIESRIGWYNFDAIVRGQ